MKALDGNRSREPNRAYEAPQTRGRHTASCELSEEDVPPDHALGSCGHLPKSTRPPPWGLAKGCRTPVVFALIPPRAESDLPLS
jgi:hypothetical protein